MSTPRHEYLSKRLGAYPSEFFSCPDSRLKGGGLHSVAVQLQWLWPPSPFAHGARQSPGKWRTPPGSASVSSTAHALPSCWTGSSPAAAALPHSAPALRAGQLLPVCLPPTLADLVHPSSTSTFSLRSDTVKRMKKQDTGENICET